MLPFLKKYLETQGGTNHALIYSIWEGYKQTSPLRFAAGWRADGGVNCHNMIY